MQPYVKALSFISLCSISAYSTALDPAAIELGVVDFTPTLKIEAGNDSNLYRQEDDETSSTELNTRVDLNFAAQNKLDTYQASIYFDSMVYGSSEKGDDDTIDMGLLLDAYWDFNSKNNLGVYLHHEKLHDDRGSAFSADDPFSIKEPDKYDQTKYGAKYGFDTENKLFFSAEAFQMHKKYTNNEGNSFTPGTEVRNYTQTELDLIGNFRISPKTSLFLEIDTASFDYDEDYPVISQPDFETLDSTETRVYAGVSWEASALTTGRAKIGQSKKQFDDSDFLDDQSTFSWDASITYTPTEVDNIDFYTGSNFRETEASGAAIETVTFGASWRRQWLKRLSTSVNIHNQNDDHGQRLVNPNTNNTPKNRKDTLNSLTLNVTYNFRRWLDFGGVIIIEDNSSNLDGYDYNRNYIGINASMGL